MANVKATDLIDFTRASKGHAMAKVSYGSEEVTNGAFDSDTTGWAPARCTAAVSSGQVVLTSTSTNPVFTQTLNLTIGKLYRLEGDIIGGTGTANPQINMFDSGFSSYDNLSASGSFSFIPTTATNYVQLRVQGTTIGDTATFDNISVKEVTFDQPDGTLQLFEFPNNVPRIEYTINSAGDKFKNISSEILKGASGQEPQATEFDTLVNGQKIGDITNNGDVSAFDASMYISWFEGSLTNQTYIDYIENVLNPYIESNLSKYLVQSGEQQLGLLIEESRTNTIQYSEDFENSYWGKGGGFSIYGNHGIAPDGTRTATLLTDINDEDSYIIEPNICSNGQTKSVWIRTVSGTATLNVLTHHDQSDGEVTVTEEWQRFERAVDISEPGGDDFFIFDTRSGTNTASDIYIWGAQLETGGFATSYIRSNSGGSTTRSSDIVSMPIDFGYNLTEGTVTATFQRMGIQSSGNDYIVQFYEAFDQRTSMLLDSTNDRTYSAQGGAQNQFYLGSPVTGRYTKIAYAFTTNDFAASRDGGTVLTDTSGTFDGTGHATVHIGNNNGGEVFTGHLKSIQYIPRRLSNAKLQELSS